MGFSKSDHSMSLSDSHDKDLRMNSDAQQCHERNSSSTSTPPPQNQLNASEFQEQEDEKTSAPDSALKVKVPSSHGVKDSEEEDDEPRTPTSLDHKIPVTTTCPPAPRKPKTVPMANKRKTPTFRGISVDLRVMINAMVTVAHVPDILAGDLAAGDHAKKVKKANVATGRLIN